MNETVTINMENLSTEEREQFMKLVEKGNKKKSKVWEPEEYEPYFFIGPSGIINGSYYEADASDKRRYSIGNCFRTEEEAKFVAEKIKVIAELKRFAEENNEKELNWDKYSHSKYLLVYNYESKNIIIDYTRKHKFNSIYFSSIDIAKKAIETIGEDRIKKYYFEVEE